MTEDPARDAAPTNVDNTAHIVGVQGHTIHHAEVHQTIGGETPRQTYEAGVRYLEDGAVAEARTRIGRAMHGGHDDATVRFHWVLAMLSKRDTRDLSRDERQNLHGAAQRFLDEFHDSISGGEPVSGNSDADHHTALVVVSELVICLLATPRDTGRITDVEKRILDLPPYHRAAVGRHLGRVLKSATQEKLWLDAVERARTQQKAADRTNRAWMYFEPKPTGVWIRALDDPRAERRWVRPVLRALPTTTPAALAAGYLGWVTATSLIPGAIVASAVALVGACFLARHAFEWRYRVQRLRHEDSVRGLRPLAEDDVMRKGKTDRFAAQVTRYFDYYFAKYRPDDFRLPGGWDRWLATTERIRHHLCDEVERTYRSSDVTAESIAWLIRYLARDVRRRWLDGTLEDFRERYAVPRRTKALAVLCGLVSAGALLVVVPVAAQTAPFTSLLAVVTAGVTAPRATRQWFSFAGAIRSHKDDEADVGHDRERRQHEYERWTQRLAQRPSEEEMTTWFTCDTTLLMEEALGAFGLRRGNVESHMVLSAKMPTGSRYRVKSARDAMGPWRYSRYELSVFLVLRGGLHSYTRRWDFENVETIGDAERFHFPLEKIESGSSPHDRLVTLTLIGGTVKRFAMSDDGTVEPEGHRAHERDDQDGDAAPSPDSAPGPDLSVFRDASGLIELRRTFERVSQGRTEAPG